MAQNSVGNIVLEASRIGLPKVAHLYGFNNYLLSSNFITWDNTHNYKLEDIALTFGSLSENGQNETGDGMTGEYFQCGNDRITGFDFGLLYSVFKAMIMARVELGTSFPVEEETLTERALQIIWFGNECIIYSTEHNLIVPIKDADIKTACGKRLVKVRNFTSNNDYSFEVQGMSFCFSRSDGAVVAKIRIPDCVLRSYSSQFSWLEGEQEKTEKHKGGSSSWDEGSQLGVLIESSSTRAECEAVLKKYLTTPTINSLVAREDLICKPTQKYGDTTDFFGSICYTDKKEVVLPITFRRGLFVYKYWFASDSGNGDDLNTDSNADFSEFYNVTDDCARIIRFANTVVDIPISIAKLDIRVFNRIRQDFLNMRLQRIPLPSSFGRVVIPEELLVNEITSGHGEALLTILPVGVIDDKIVCKETTGQLTISKPSGWSMSGYFYDVTEVAQSVG